MNFQDFKPEELVGKYVLIIDRYSRKIKKISKVTKASFKVDGDDSNFSLVGGRKRGGDTWYPTYAELISEEEAKLLSREWKETKLKKELIDKIKEKIDSVASLERLQEIYTLIEGSIIEANQSVDSTEGNGDQT